MKSELNGTVSLVTGAARGIGLAIADRLAANGSTVIYTDIDTAELEKAVGERDGVIGKRLDITDAGEIRAVLEEIVTSLGRIDLLVNNAGVNTLEHRVTIDEFPRHEWDRIVDIDLSGTYEVSRAFAAAMRAQGSGRIVNILSVVGLVPLRLQCAFVAAKAGLANLTKAMAIELAPYGILVNGIAPGSIMTEGTRKLFYGEDGKFNDKVQRFLDHVPLARPGTTDEIAVAVQFLADPENTYTNGHILTVDGGWTAGYARDF
jgi:3-oxoacyl-[acyl-carrier protein] reductase